MDIQYTTENNGKTGTAAGSKGAARYDCLKFDGELLPIPPWKASLITGMRNSPMSVGWSYGWGQAYLSELEDWVMDNPERVHFYVKKNPAPAKWEEYHEFIA